MREERPGGGGGDDWFGGDDDWLDIDTAERDAIRRERRELERAARRGWEDEPSEPSSEELQQALGVGQGEPEPEPPSAPEPEPDTGTRRLRDDPYTPAKVPVPGGRRQRHRDMPAKIRRRQAAGAGLVVVALIILGFVVFSGGEEKSEPTPLKELVGQTVIGKVGKGGPDENMLQRVRKGRLGGVIMTAPRNERDLREQVELLQAAAEKGGRPPLLVMIDQEGGPVKRLPGPPEVGPSELGRAGDADQAKSEGESTGQYLSELGVNVDLAPDLDVALPRTDRDIANRTFGEDPAVVSDLGVGFGEGLQDGGVSATAKHFPGLGPATTNTDDGAVTIAASPEELDAALEPFRSAADAGLDLFMVATASYPQYGSEKPAALSAEIVQGLLRDELGYDGLVITDDLETDAIEDDLNSGPAAVGALTAGNDMVMFATSDRGASRGFDAIVGAAKAERLDRSILENAYDRITDFKNGL
jgi:beta-N-acetylhexosaminidase